jgi:hypothetical protein
LHGSPVIRTSVLTLLVLLLASLASTDEVFNGEALGKQNVVEKAQFNELSIFFSFVVK